MSRMKDVWIVIQDLITSADQEGCSPDLAVVDAQLLLDLAKEAGLPKPSHICTDPNEDEVA